jgi:uncharacterized protein (TIGR00725 family)
MGSGSEEHEALAAALGRLLARLGVNLLTGAGGGVMTAVSRAFVEAQPATGISIGIVPCAGLDDRAEPKAGYPNAFVQLPILTHLPYSGPLGRHDLSRNHINVLSSAAIVALPGGDGTVSEVELAVRYGKPVVAFCADPAQVAQFHGSVRRLKAIEEVEAFLREVLRGLA